MGREGGWVFVALLSDEIARTMVELCVLCYRYIFIRMYRMENVVPVEVYGWKNIDLDETIVFPERRTTRGGAYH